MPTINDCTYLQALLADSLIRADTAVHASMNKVRLSLLLMLDITRRQTHRSFFTLTVNHSHVSHKDKQQENHELKFHLNLSNFPDEAQLQLILLRAFAQYFKLSHFNHSYYTTPYIFHPHVF